ncbi:17-beta-hydroxysteroid dehydrogenase type 2 [Tachyglossus aculeatus]|uniref:17-beta-hydroxysteroid dehydrogenase type 2 n=1 Tax=Tachyglossus aculeatus TaxID=9261 RepID=UPI0018F46295|nr:17-beta-hydroxysteroid dehydrogenase type 2 [Tachyglossus aculeatus]
MNAFFSAAGLLSLGATAVFGGIVLYKLEKNHGKIGNKAIYSIALLFLGEVYCFSSLSYFWGFSLFSLACIISHIYLSGQEMLPVDQKAVLITGGDSGIGHTLVKHLDELGFTVFAGVLNEKGPGAEELRRSCSERLTVLQMDVTDSAQLKEAHRRVLAKVKGTGLWAVVNNAGIIGFPGDGELTSMNIYRQCMDVNFFGAVEVTKTFLPLLRKAKGRLVNISSMAGSSPLPNFSAYGSSKAALTMFSGVTRLELSRWGVKVTLIQPGGFRTNIQGSPDQWEAQEKDLLENLQEDVKEDYGKDYIQALKSVLKSMSKSSSTDLSPVVFAVLHAILSKHSLALYTPGTKSYLTLCLSSFFPIWVSDAFFKKLFSLRILPKALQKPDPPNKKL